MPILRQERGADSPLVDRVSRVVFDGHDVDVTTPDGCWDIVIMRRQGQASVLQTGVITRPVTLDFGSGDEYLCISFKPGVFMPGTSAEQLVDRAFLRPVAGDNSFWFDGDRLEIPTFENAEGLVSRLLRRQALARDEIVAGIADGDPRAISERSVQRHFQHSMGVTAKRFDKIQRARRAVELLRSGTAIATVAHQLGYSDQAHLTRDLKALMGRTPGAIARQRPP
jgi:AraC-like DNA-binding protein